ncbi:MULTISPECIES: hypothetical protein [Achromobacter]|uniref:hypothetical protein n=1 Tax=Achromobacter TaxID=222 RepID=UPI00244BE10B|nr:hypothetical protein [Achromobacter mucicolens]MDH0093729.1 hypothetical protein [Achromobacter mucicolens]
MRGLLKFLGGVACFLALPWSAIVLWGAFTPAVFLHYSDAASEEIGVFFNDNHDTDKFGMMPGETVTLRTAMFPRQEMWILLTFPTDSTDSLEITKPFRRIDVCIGAGAKIEKTEIRHGWLDRFTEPKPSCKALFKR